MHTRLVYAIGVITAALAAAFLLSEINTLDDGFGSGALGALQDSASRMPWAAGCADACSNKLND